MYTFRYAFTITVQPKYYKKKAEDQYDLIHGHLRARLNALTNAYTLVTELTKSFSCHWHGIISFPLSKSVYSYPKMFYDHFRDDPYVGFCNIKQITEDQVWTEYIKKDISDTRKILGRRPIIEDYFDIFDSDERSLYACQF